MNLCIANCTLTEAEIAQLVGCDPTQVCQSGSDIIIAQVTDILAPQIEPTLHQLQREVGVRWYYTP